MGRQSHSIEQHDTIRCVRCVRARLRRKENTIATSPRHAIMTQQPKCITHTTFNLWLKIVLFFSVYLHFIIFEQIRMKQKNENEEAEETCRRNSNPIYNPIPFSSLNVNLAALHCAHHQSKEIERERYKRIIHLEYTRFSQTKNAFSKSERQTDD